jgi:DNA-binding NtrC family response regulator
MLALSDSNRLVMEFGQAEILTNTSLPVFFGATTFGCTGDFGELIGRIADAGFHGVVNFPSCVFLDGRYRQFLEESGLGLEREIELLAKAREHGLATLAYVHTLEEAHGMAAAEIEMVNLDFGWNVGGTVGVESELGLEEATALAREFVEGVRAIDGRTRCLIEGGPIVTPEQLEQVCSLSKADGYIGGSTIDRVPLESAIEMATSAFKTIGSLRRQIDSLEKQLSRRITTDAVIGLGELICRARESVAQAMDSDAPVLIVGQPGTGRREIARLIHDERICHGRWIVIAECMEDAVQEAELRLFGCVTGAFPGVENSRAGLLDLARGSTLVLDDVGALPVPVQRQLLQAVESGGFWARGAARVMPLNTRFIGISCFDPAAEADARRFDPAFAQWLSAIRIDLPPLQERLEDLPMLAENMLRAVSQGERRKLDRSAYRTLLSYRWPGNLRELRAVLQKAALAARGPVIAARDLPPLSTSRASARKDKASFSSEREWILDGLKKNRFRRGATAQFLGLSRKTLYNKMAQHGLIRRTPDSERSARR